MDYLDFPEIFGFPETLALPFGAYQLSLEVSRIHSPQNLLTTSSSRQMVNPSHQHPSDTKGLIVGLTKENQWFS